MTVLYLEMNSGFWKHLSFIFPPKYLKKGSDETKQKDEKYVV